MKTNTAAGATTMVVNFKSTEDVRDYTAGLFACKVSYSRRGNDVLVRIDNGDTETARALAERYLPTFARVLWE
jgi:Zn-finger domain-containing protein